MKQRFIKILECYVNAEYERCSMMENSPKCEMNLISDALNLINHYKEMVKRLKQENIILSRNADTAFQDGLNEAQDLYAEQVRNEIKSEVVREFIKRLKAKIHNYYPSIDNCCTSRKDWRY